MQRDRELFSNSQFSAIEFGLPSKQKLDRALVLISNTCLVKTSRKPRRAFHRITWDHGTCLCHGLCILLSSFGKGPDNNEEKDAECCGQKEKREPEHLGLLQVWQSGDGDGDLGLCL